MRKPIESQTSRRTFLRAGSLASAGLLLESQWAQAESPATSPGDAPPKLKVTDIKTYILKTGHTLVEIFTDGGITGIGELTSIAGCWKS